MFAPKMYNFGFWSVILLFLFIFQDLIRQMLDVEPSKRPSAAQILSHPWMTSLNPLSTQLVVGAKVEDVKVRFLFSQLCS